MRFLRFVSAAVLCLSWACRSEDTHVQGDAGPDGSVADICAPDASSGTARVPLEYLGVRAPDLATEEATWICDVDPASVGSNLPSDPNPYPVVRRQGCGLVIDSSPPNWWDRTAIYDATSGQRIGAHTMDDVPSTLKGTNCTAYEYVAGDYPPPTCADEVVHYCRNAP